MGKEEAKKFVQGFMKEINEQNNRCTATPYFYVIRTAEWVASYHEGEGDRVIVTHDCETVATAECKDDVLVDVRKHCKEYYDDEDIDFEKMDDWDFESFLEDKEYSFFWEVQTWREECCFFTDTEAKAHLKANHYHYSEDAHTYVKHFWRAPGVKKFFESVAIMCDIEYVNH